jgi:hypothetical protein
MISGQYAPPISLVIMQNLLFKSKCLLPAAAVLFDVSGGDIAPLI